MAFIQLTKGTSLKLINCKTTNNTNIIDTLIGKSIVYPKGSFFKLEYGVTLTVQDFEFSGTTNFNFI